MIIFPAIDIKDETCVRLYKGAMESAEKVAESYLDTALAFKQAGSTWIHMVDLNGACEGVRKNTHIFTDVAEHAGLKVEVGGGIRTMEDVAFYLERGIARVVIGSAAVKNPALVREACSRYGDRIAVGIDARNGLVATEGWVETSEVSYLTLAKEMEQAGVKTIIFTDIDRDGTLTGPNLEQLTALNEVVSCDVVASGGIRNIDDIRALRDAGLYGAICGRSIYNGTLSLPEAIALCEA
mgnify:FL=1